MPKGYHHLTHAQRCQIQVLLHSNMSKNSIATIIGVHPSTISREVKRHSSEFGYRHQYAQHQADVKRRVASKTPKKMTSEIIQKIEFLLRELQWSPEQICGRMRRCNEHSVSYERIYQHIWNDKKCGGSLWKHLGHNGKKYNKRIGKTAGRGLIPHRVDISERPQIVEDKARIGDWEADTIIGKKHKGAIFSCVDRARKLTVLELLPTKSAQAVTQACQRSLWALAKAHTITFDNGKEFANHRTIAQSLGVKTYFAKPYRSCDRGLNEHTNGLVRQYFSKSSSFTSLTSGHVKEVENKLNMRPRKILGFLTPFEVFYEKNKSGFVALQS